MTADPSLRLRTEPHLAAGGDAIARHPDGRVVFVVGAAPDEEVEVEVLKDNRSFLRARVTKVLTPSPRRVEPRCAHVEACGGCTLQHVDPAAQLESKQAGLLSTLARIGKVDVDQIQVEPPWSGPAFGYRTRARLVMAGGLVGFRAEKSRRVVDVRQCPVLAPELQDVLTTLRAAVKTTPERRRSAGGKPAEVSLLTNGERVLASFPPGNGALVRAVTKASGPTVESGDAALCDANDGHGEMLLSPRVFAQGNREGNRALLEHLEAVIPEGLSTAVELYSGSGNFTRVLARRAAEVQAFEGSREGVALARRAAPDHVTVNLGSVAEGFAGWLEDGGRADLVLVDPPRAGLEPQVVQAILQASPRHLVYVSCDPATFARDAVHLEAGGLRLRRVRLFDLYPQTGHAEVVGVFERA